MPLATRSAPRTFESRMLAMADRLFSEFDDLPVIDVFRAIGRARAELRDSDGVAVPEHVERAARYRLSQARRAVAHG